LRHPLEVWKFGGASLADAAAIRKAAELAAAHAGPLVVVASALAGVTDLLLDGARAAVSGDTRQASKVAATFLVRHRRIARELLPGGAARRRLLAAIDAAAREYRELCAAVAVLGHLAPRASDMLVARGERMSATMLAAVLTTARRPAVYADALDIVATDDQHGGAAPSASCGRS
jgi:aspartokinase/homoserine dehydrogenase 1